MEKLNSYNTNVYKKYSDKITDKTIYFQPSNKTLINSIIPNMNSCQAFLNFMKKLGFKDAALSHYDPNYLKKENLYKSYVKFMRSYGVMPILNHDPRYLHEMGIFNINANQIYIKYLSALNIKPNYKKERNAFSELLTLGIELDNQEYLQKFLVYFYHKYTLIQKFCEPLKKVEECISLIINDSRTFLINQQNIIFKLHKTNVCYKLFLCCLDLIQKESQENNNQASKILFFLCNIYKSILGINESNILGINDKNIIIKENINFDEFLLYYDQFNILDCVWFFKKFYQNSKGMIQDKKSD